MSKSKKQSQSMRVERDRQLLAGLVSHFGKNEVFVVKGEKMKCSEMIAILEERIRVAEPVAPAKATWLALRTVQELMAAKTDDSVTGLREFLRVMHAGDPKHLAELGIVPTKRRRTKRPSGQQPAPASPVATTNGTALPH